MSKQRIFHSAPTVVSAGMVPGQFVVINVDGIDKMVPLPRALNVLHRGLSEGVEEANGRIDQVKKRLEEFIESLDGVYVHRGDVFGIDYLPENPKKGDCYNVLHSFTLDGSTYPTGTNVAWTGKKWDTLGGRIEIDEGMQNEIIELLSPQLKSLAEESIAELFNWNQL